MPQLGLSASVVKEESPGITSGDDPHLPRRKLSGVGVGDRITVTAADGSSRVYRVTGRRVVDPHLAETGSGSADDGALVSCLLTRSLKRVIQATKVDPPAREDPRPEQKL